MSSPAAPTPEAPAHGDGGVTTYRPPRRLKGPKRKGAPRVRKRTFWGKLWLATQIGLVIFIIVAIIGGYYAYEKGLYYYARAKTIDLKKLDDLNVTSTFYDVNGEELGRIFVEDRIVLTPDQIPETMRQAVMAAEDRRFYEHGAIDYWGIMRALRQDFSKHSHGVQGGSTIEQQLAKHLIGDFSRTLDRKFLEAFVAIRLEKALTKDQIMNYYLNRIYFGKGYFGVGAAARGYFNKDAINLTVPECALLAGIIRSPTTSSPRTDRYRAKLHRDITLKQMYEDGYIKTHEEYSRAVNTAIQIQPAKPNGLQSFVMAAAVKEMEHILEIEGTEEAPQGLTVRTNINLRLQRAIEEQMDHNLDDLANSAQKDEPESVPPLNPTMAPAPGTGKPLLQDAAIVADVATGRVLAWVGGRDFARNQFDHVSMARRENGALLQPLVYALGFDRLDLQPSSMINASFIDTSTTPAPGDLELGNPATDLNRRFLSVQDALALGNRGAATRVGLKLGAKPFAGWLKQAGVEQARVPDDKPGVFNPDPMTLGDVASLYQILGNGGVRHKLKIIQSIEARNGEVLYDDTKTEREKSRNELLNNLDDQQMTLTLQNALRSGFARSLTQDYGLKSAVAGMPGYSDGYRDAWFVGYTPTLVAGVWVGYDDSRAIGSKEMALKAAAPLWGNVMQQVQARVATGGSFPVPDAFSKVEIDRYSGALRGMAGLAPAPGDIFVYLKKDQVEAAGLQKANSGPQIQAPREWSDWLTTMFNDADETGLSPDQIVESDKRSNIIPALAEYKLPGLRGDLLASDGTVYATMGTEHNLVLSWPAADAAASDADIVQWVRSRLAEVQKAIGVQVDLSDADIVSEYRTLRYQPLLVLENITPVQIGMIQAAGLEAKGLGFQVAPRRIYPRGTELAHVLGYLSRDQQRNRGKYLSGDVMYDRYKGAAGIEQVFNGDLIGKDGRFMISTTPDGYARSAAVAEPATYGNNVRLSIDPKFQAAVEQALTDSPHKTTAAVMLDVTNGDVIAMASRPTFDPNIFVPSIEAGEWQILNGDTTHPLLNRAIQAQYPPGSTFKTVTSIAAMAAGVFDPNWVVHCTGYFDLDNSHRMELKDEHGDVTYQEALTFSYNTYFATLGEKIGRDILLDTARSLNLGNATTIKLPGEVPGLIPDPEFVKRIHQREFGYGDIALTAIGQGDVLVTPLQMADLMATYANNGTVYRPRLIQQVEGRDGKTVKAFPPETLRTVTFNPKWMPLLRQAMIDVIDKGTAKTAHRDDFQIAAKTGTAQVGSKEHRRQIAWLCGYFPADKPKYSFAVMVEGTFAENHGSGLEDGLLGGRDAGQIVKEIMSTVYGKKGATADDDSAKTAENREAADTNDDDDSNPPPKKTAAPVAHPPKPAKVSDAPDTNP